MESDQFSPEYWPANKIIGKLEKALVKAENILGLIQSTQIANLAAGKITGLITSAQIAEIEAAKIGGQLTNTQIKEIEAAKITGQLTNAQIKEIEAAKITGLISETQIGPEAISTPLLKAGAVTAAKVAAEAITAEKIAALTITAGKIAANAVTAEKINALAVTAGKIAAEAVTTEKLAANSVTAAKIVAGTITAEKLSVVTLSAIAVNAGTITAGTFKGVTFETAEEGLKINNEGINLFVGEEETPNARRKIDWFKGAARVADISATLTASETLMRINSIGAVSSFESALIAIRATGASNLPASLELFSKKGKKEISSIGLSVGATEEEAGQTIKLIESGKKSGQPASRFLQHAPTGIGAVPALYKAFNVGVANVTYPGGSADTTPLVVNHNLGTTPIAVVGTGTFQNVVVGITNLTATTFQITVRDSEGAPGAGAVSTVFWIAVC